MSPPTSDLAALVGRRHITSKYAGWYSVRDEAFFTENEIPMAAQWRAGGVGRGAELFFRLVEMGKPLEFYAANPDFIRPESRLHEVISFVKGGPRSSVSRPAQMGHRSADDDQHTVRGSTR